VIVEGRLRDLERETKGFLSGDQYIESQMAEMLKLECPCSWIPAYKNHHIVIKRWNQVRTVKRGYNHTI
jgi:hypothetical protein